MSTYVPPAPLIPPDSDISSIIVANLMKNYDDLDMGTNKIINLAEPVSTTDATTKSYVDTRAYSGNISGPITITGTTSSISSQTGSGTTFVMATAPTIASLLVSSGLTTDTLDATSTDTINYVGSLGTPSVMTDGGMIIAKDLYIGASLFLNDSDSIASEPHSMGVANLPGGTSNAVAVSNSTLTYFGHVFLTNQNLSGTAGQLWISDVNGSGSFVINSSSPTDQSTIAWMVVRYVGICFHKSCTVQLENGYITPLTDLVHGQKVLSHYKDNIPIYSKVISFSGYDLESAGASLKIYVNGLHFIELSPEHLIHVKDTFKRAEDLKIGDIILYNNKPTRIFMISKGHNNGFISPLTESGTIVVNGISCSCHTHDTHNLVRFIYLPLRLWLWIWPHKKGTKPTGNSFFSVYYRRGIFGRFLTSLLRPFF